MRHIVSITVLLAAAAACGGETVEEPEEPQEQQFSVDVAVTLTPFANGCDVTWKAKASDPQVEVNYTVETQRPGGPGQTWGTGSFRDSTVVGWAWAIVTFDILWSLSAGTWTDFGNRAVNDCS